MADMLMESMAERQASRVVLLDLEGVSLIADYFLIGSAETPRQLEAIVRQVEEDASDAEISPLRVEGTAESGWIVIDFGAVVIHLFQTAQRDFYQLENLWHRAQTVAVMP